MSMSTHVIAIRPPDERWMQMEQVYLAVQAAGLPVPAEVDRFFDGDRPDPAGVVIHIDPDRNPTMVRKWADDSREGLEVVLSELPPDIKVIRFYNSW
jgi:radical SAM superfamily enzyme with C-terminal helix-hairpin-helix motif